MGLPSHGARTASAPPIEAGFTLLIRFGCCCHRPAAPFNLMGSDLNQRDLRTCVLKSDSFAL